MIFDGEMALSLRYLTEFGNGSYFALVSDVVEKIQKVDELSTKILVIYLQQ